LNKKIDFIALGQDKIYTDATGMKQFLAFHDECRKHVDCTIPISLANIEWIDGNMCAVLAGLLYSLSKERELRFSFDSQEVATKFNNILLRNGFLDVEMIGERNKDITALPFQAFNPKDKDAYISYLFEKLLTHNGMPNFTDDELAKIVDDLTELLSNINLHAQTENPFFICGQFYPAVSKVKVTVSDIGLGFLPKIAAHTKNAINTAKDAITWAVNGNTIKTDATGGINLRRMKDYFTNSGGEMHIVTGNAYWNTANIGTVLYPDGIIEMPHEILGTTIHLVFNKK